LALKAKARLAGLGTLAAGALAASVFFSSTIGCGSGDEGCALDVAGTRGILSAGDVQQAVAQAATRAAELGTAVTIAVADRQGNPLAVFVMNGSAGSQAVAYTNARTASFFGTNGNAFTTRTAGFIIQDQYPPGVPNTPAGPLFGVQFSSLSCSDIQTRGAGLLIPASAGGGGLSNFPGSFPLYTDGGQFAAGGLGVNGSGDPLIDEQIAVAGAQGFEPARDGIRGDHIFLDGFRLPFVEATSPPVTAAPVAGAFVLGPLPTQETGFPRRTLGNGIIVEQPIPTTGGAFLTADEVDLILAQGAKRGEETRAAIRECGPMKMNVSVVDVNGRALGTIRTLDAPIFGFDVSVQKARTAAAFSDPGNDLGQQIRGTVGVPQGAPFAVSTRAVGFLSQIHYPPAVEGTPHGPFGRDPNKAGDLTLQMKLSKSCAPSGNGITIFPGGLPLYKGTQLVGAIGVSGDGVDQDDIVAEAGTRGFEAPEAIRTSAVVFLGARLPYFKEPRNPGTQ
jgi:uncharacterized protein GlcG (DUF336 family)